MFVLYFSNWCCRGCINCALGNLLPLTQQGHSLRRGQGSTCSTTTGGLWYCPPKGLSRARPLTVQPRAPLTTCKDEPFVAVQCTKERRQFGMTTDKAACALRFVHHRLLNLAAAEAA